MGRSATKKNLEEWTWFLTRIKKTGENHLRPYILSEEDEKENGKMIYSDRITPKML